jgi:undecaprenyl diphosphate synthase
MIKSALNLIRNNDEKEYSVQDISPPRHIAIIMDGNGRWASSRGLPRLEGHLRGVESVRRVVRSSIELGVSFLTLYAFSTENWRRSDQEVNGLMMLARRYIQSDLADLHKNGVHLKMIGDPDQLPQDVAHLIKQAEAKTKQNKSLTLILAVNYGSRDEITRATKQIAMDLKDGLISDQEINETLFSSYLDTADIPDPDMLIRTSGVNRISNYLLWQLSYAELIFIDKHWPDVTKKDLVQAIEEYKKRDRRFGAVNG